MADDELVEREERQLRLMLDRIERFRRGELSIGPVINDLEALLNELELVSDDWRGEFIDAWSELEIPYAVALDRLQELPSAQDPGVSTGIDEIDRLVRSQLRDIDTRGPDGSEAGDQQRVDSDEFMAALRREFPELVEEFNEPTWKGLLHLETACLARSTEGAMSDGDRDRVRRDFDFVRRMWLDGDERVQNAIEVSYFENLDFSDEEAQRSWAIDEIPVVLRALAVELSIGVDG